MSVRDRLIQLTLRARNFLSGDVQPATDSMRELTEEGRRLKASMDDVGRARGMARTLRDNQQATEGLARAQDDARATLDDLTRELGDNAEATAGQRIAMREARRTLDEAERAYKKNQSAIKNLTTELKQMGVDTDNVTAEEKRLAGELEDGKKALGDNREAIKQKRLEEKKAADATKEHADRVEATGTAMNDAGRKVLGFVAAYVSLNAVMGLVQSGLRLVAQGIRAVTTDGSEKQQALAQIEAALASTGRQAEFTSQQLLDMADAFEASSMLTAEQVQSAQTRLLSYTDVAATEFPRAMQIIIDQQQRLGISAEQSAEIVGRALQSPSAAIATLGRQGFKLEEGQKRLLKQLEATGQMAKAQTIIMDMLAEAYGGSATAARMNTFQGLLKGIGDRFGDFASRVSNAGVFEYLQRRLRGVADYLDQMANDGRLDRLAQALSDAFVQGVEKAEAFAKRLLDVDFNKLVDDSTRWLSGFGDGVDKATAAVDNLSEKTRGFWNVLTLAGNAADTFWGAFKLGILETASMLASTLPDALGGAKWKEQIDQMALGVRAGIKSSIDGVKTDFADLRDSIAGTGREVAAEAENGARATTAAIKSELEQQRMLDQAHADQLVANQNKVKDAALAAAASGAAAITDIGNAISLIDTASSVAQLEGLRGAMLAAFQDGSLSQDQYAQATSLLSEKLNTLGGSAAGTGDSLADLGEDFGDLASIMRAVGSAMNEVDFNRLRTGIRKAYSDGKISAEEFAKAQAELNKRITDLKPAADKGTRALGEQRKAIDENMQSARRGIADVGDAAEGASGGIDFFGSVLTAARTPLANMSKAALDLFDTLRGIKKTDVELDVSSAEKTAAALSRVREEALGLTAELGRIGSRDYGFGTWMRETALRSREVQAEYLAQKLRLQELTEGYSSGAMSAAAFARAARSAKGDLKLLDESDLSSLESSIQSAEQQMKQLGESSRSTLESLQDELDKLEGREADAERRRFAARRRELEVQLDGAQASGDRNAVANAQRSISVLRQIEAATAQKRQQDEQQKRLAATAPTQAAAAAVPQKIIRLETSRGKAVEVAVSSAADETNLLSILEEAGARAI